jgi:prephenate dehydratase
MQALAGGVRVVHGGVRNLDKPRVRVAFQGEKGSYSHEACERYFGHRIEVKPFRTLREVFHAVERGSRVFGVVPIENSYEGGINETYDLLAGTKSKVCGETQVRVRHCLIAKPGTRLHNVKTVYSHPQALAQCARYLRVHKLDPVPTYDTAGSVRLIKAMRSRSVAAIASKRAAELNSMQILAEGIEDSDVNYTRFLVLGKKIAPLSGDDKTSIIFGVEHTPGSLYRCLKVLSTRRINLMKIESRPVKNTPWQYNFYVDFHGHVRDKPTQEALSDLRERATFVKVLGSYPRATSSQRFFRTGWIKPARSE